MITTSPRPARDRCKAQVSGTAVLDLPEAYGCRGWRPYGQRKACRACGASAAGNHGVAFSDQGLEGGNGTGSIVNADRRTLLSRADILFLRDDRAAARPGG